MNILIIQILRMGDALQLVPIIKGIKHFFPQSWLCILTSKLGAMIVEGLEEVDEAFVLDKEGVVDLLMTPKKEKIFETLDRLKADLEQVGDIKWDWVINFSYTFSSALLSFILDAKHRSGFMANKNRQYLSKEKWFAYSMASFVNRRYSNFNWVDINKNIVGFRSLPSPPFIVPKGEDISKASAYLEQAGLGNKKIVGMHPGASGDYKRWPVERFGELGRALVNRHGYNIVIFGGGQEKELGNRLKVLIGNGAQNLANKTTLHDLKAFLSLCDVLVTNDTGPMHIAAAVGTRTIGLFFSTHFVETGPYGSGHVAVHPDISCFPCQGTAECLHKKCLEYIAPETIETIVVNGEKYAANGGMDFLGQDKRKVKVYFSTFDPWGNLDWVPLDKSPLTFQAVERILLRTSWLYASDSLDGADNSEKAYIANLLDLYGESVDKTDLTADMDEFIGKLRKFRGWLETAQKNAFDIQSEFLSSHSDTLRVRDLGEKLKEAESEISSLDKNSVLSFLSELLAVLQENVEQADPLGLSTKTIGIYQDMKALTDVMIKRSQKMAALLSGNV